MKRPSRFFFIKKDHAPLRTAALAAVILAALAGAALPALAASGTASTVQVLKVPAGKDKPTPPVKPAAPAKKTAVKKKASASPADEVAASAAARPVIHSIRTGMNASKTRIVIELDRPVTFRAFTLSNPTRLIVDIPPARWKTSQDKLLTAELLKGYRSGQLETGLTRIAFDMRRLAVIDTAFLLPKSGTSTDRLVIDLQPASAEMFAARERQVVGDDNILANKDGKLPVAEKLSPQLSLSAPPAGAEETQSETDAGEMPPKPPKKPSALKPSTMNDVTALSPAEPVAEQPAPVEKQQQRKKKDKYTVVIDAGHGGDDPGAIAVNGVREKDITLAVARELKRQLEETGRYRVVMTRDRDIYIPLRGRVDISRQKEGDVFISIHADKIDRSAVSGASIYTLSATASDAETGRLAEQENNAGVVAGVDLSNESEDVAGILLDLSMREKMNESNLLARYLQKSFRRENVELLPNSHRSAGFAVLKAPDVPAALIETGFLSNPQQAKLLNSSAFQRKIASAIQGGIDAFFEKMEALERQ